LLLIDGFFFHIFSAWNTTIWEAVWLSLLLLETRCEKVCLFSYFVQSLSVSGVCVCVCFFFFLCVCVCVFYIPSFFSRVER
jgi:signal transduction histidine kinase